MLNILNIIIFAVSIILPIMVVQPARAEGVIVTPSIWISEVQTGGIEDEIEFPKNEFIELYNPANVNFDVSGWRLEYLSSTHLGEGEPTRIIAKLNGSVMAGSFVLLSYAEYIQGADIYFGEGSLLASGLLAKSGGHVRLVNEAGFIIDQVGWGIAKQIDDWPRTQEIPPSFSINRIMPDDPLFNLGALFMLPSQTISPEGGGLVIPEAVEVELPIVELPIVENPVSNLSCEGIILSELLPNPAGADTGREFIELHNPTDETILLDGCSLQTSANYKTYELTAIEMQPGSYLALYDSQTNLTLPNASGGTVWLLTDTEELQAVSYEGGLGDDVAWALIGSSWMATYSPSPGADNVLISHKPCPAGQERSLTTNRCISPIELVAATVVPCRDGQERNPETNRCRSVVSVASSLVPCKSNQERNPETNRCRNIASSNELAPCKEGQERNPDTNRCRNITASGGGSVLGAVKDIESPAVSDNMRWWISGFALLAAIGYAVYEWRRDFVNFIIRIKGKFFKATKLR